MKAVPDVKIARSFAAGFLIRVAVATAALFLVVGGVWTIVLPEGLIKDIVERSADNDYVYLRLDGFRKGLLFDFSAEKILVMKRGPGKEAGAPLLELDDLEGRLKPLSLVTFRPAVSLRCRLNGGEVSGVVALTRLGRTTISSGRIDMSEVPFLGILGIHGEGILSGSFSAENNIGSLKLSLDKATFRNASPGGVFLPLEMIHDVRAAATIRGNTVQIRSLALSGDGVYGRVSGSVRSSYMDMKFELMTEPSFELAPLLRAMIERYRVSPGYYVFPLKGKIPDGR